MGHGHGAASARPLLPTWAVPVGWATLVVAVVVAVVVGIVGRWTPVSDEAMITSLAIDTWSADVPLLGPPTSLSARSETPVRHPGPLPIWIMAGPANIIGAPGYGMAIGAGLIQVATLLGIAVTSRRLRTPGAPLLVLITTALLTVTGLGADGVRSPLNPMLGVLTAFAATVALWAYTSGHHRALLVFVATGSIAAQAHVVYLPFVGALIAVAVAATTLELVRGVDPRRRRRLTRRVLPASIVLGAICWSGPLIDQVWFSRNLTGLLRGGSGVDPVGPAHGIARLVESTAPWPAWLRTSPAPREDPTSLRYAAAAAILCALAAAGIRAWRRRDRATATAVVIALTACAAGAVTFSRLPADPAALRNHGTNLLWWPIGAFTYLTIALVVAATLRERYPVGLRALRAHPTARFAAPAAFAAFLIAVLAAMGPYSTTHQTGSATFGAARFHANAIEARTPAGGTIRIQAPNTTLNNYTLTQSLIAQLRLRGFDVEVDVVDWSGLFAAYRIDHPSSGTRPHTVVWVQGDRDQLAAPDGFELVATYDPSNPPEGFEGYADLRGTIFLTGGLRTSTVFVTHDDVPVLQPEP